MFFCTCWWKWGPLHDEEYLRTHTFQKTTATLYFFLFTSTLRSLSLSLSLLKLGLIHETHLRFAILFYFCMNFFWIFSIDSVLVLLPFLLEGLNIFWIFLLIYWLGFVICSRFLHLGALNFEFCFQFGIWVSVICGVNGRFGWRALGFGAWEWSETRFHWPETVAIEDAVRVLLRGLGEDINREGLKKTPFCVAKSLHEGTKGAFFNLHFVKSNCLSSLFSPLS